MMKKRIWEIFEPFIIYYLVYSAVFLIVTFLCRTVAEWFGSDGLAYLAAHAETVTGLVSGLAMIVAVVPLMPMLRRELDGHKGIIDMPGRRQSGQTAEDGKVGSGYGRNGMTVRYRKQASVSVTVLLAASSSVGLNILLALTGLVQSSASYQDVAQQQYGVALGAGIVLFGLISPVTEEIVFRGLVFNRLRRYCPHAIAVIVSGVMFGAYHGNLAQGVYGACMGILMAYLYERMHSFLVPCLFHGTANLVVYFIAQNGALHGKVFTVPGCALLLAVSGVCIWIVEILYAK